MSAIEQFNDRFPPYQFHNAVSGDVLRLMAEHAKLRGEPEIARRLSERAAEIANPLPVLDNVITLEEML